MKRIRKVSQSIPIKAKVVNSYSESEEETYSCDYINNVKANAVEKTGDTMTGDLNMQSSSVKFGNNGNVLWKEDGYGDKFRIIPNFNGAGTNNELIIQSTTGEAGTDPQNWKDLVTIHADSGQVDLIHPTYSTEEVRIGTWIDGKPIYRRVFSFQTSDAMDLNYNHGITNLDKYWINLSASYIISNNRNESLPVNWYYSPDDWARAWIRGNQIRFKSPSALGSRTMYLTIEYTKTTD